MTLNLTIVNSSGIWQSTDHRLVNPRTGKTVDEFSIKHVVFRCPDGAALLAYAGVGRVHGLDISDWIRETLRGETRTLDQSFIFIRENADVDLAPLLLKQGIPHMFSIGAFVSRRPWMVQIRNFSVQNGAVLDHFETAAKEINGPGQGFAFGDPRAVTHTQIEKLLKVATRKPRHPKDFCGFLASMNKRAAATASGKKSISAGCLTSYMPPEGEPVDSKFHGPADTRGPLVIPFLLFGIDLSESLRASAKRLANLGSSPTSSTEPLFSEGYPNPMEQSVIPRNRLRDLKAKPK